MLKGVLSRISYFYEHRYKQLLILPVFLLLFSLFILGNNYAKTGEFIQTGVSLKGGTTISIAQSFDIKEFESFLTEKYPGSDLSVRSLSRAGTDVGMIVEASDVSSGDLLKSIEEKTGPLDKSLYTIDTTGPSLGKSFFKQAMIALLLAFLAISFVVYIYFRSFLPSFYAVFSVVADLLFAMTVFVLFGLKLTTGSIAAFLMLIGYSIDTDILLTTRVLKRKEGTVSERMASTIMTGLTMTLTAVVAVTIGYFFTESELLKQITFILAWGLPADIIYTWLFNAALLRMYVEKKEKQNEH
ncbi:TPA: MMPL family transporter [Candidatus Woesearchaeota archaeon]|nr:MMPL family transporter [Candidatus Woesearchaeota archaeon]HIH39939.1 MMPL family transporter [Candidatus Woesearchaeota archaeon]